VVAHGCASAPLVPARNEIEVLHGLGGLSALNTLSLTHNRLRSIEGLEALVSLRHLNLQGNRLRCGRVLHTPENGCTRGGTVWLL